VYRGLTPVLATLLLALALASDTTRAQSALSPDRVWFSPNPGSIDYISLFEHPEAWPHARQLFSVFKFYQQHTQIPPPAVVGPNSYTALAAANAFHTLQQWGKKIAIEEPTVKEYYCTPDASGMTASIADTLASVQAVERNGATVSCASMNVKFGVIVWGNNGDADALYALDAGRLVNAIAQAFPSPGDLPDQIIVQSWAVSRTGQSLTPSNLPESTRYTHTNLLWSVYRRLRGETAPSSGTAISR
jgi:hypothetical protein